MIYRAFYVTVVLTTSLCYVMGLESFVILMCVSVCLLFTPMLSPVSARMVAQISSMYFRKIVYISVKLVCISVAE